jgi:hypothetical protein
MEALARAGGEVIARAVVGSIVVTASATTAAAAILSLRLLRYSATFVSPNARK